MRTTFCFCLLTAGLWGCFISADVAVGDEPVVEWEKTFGGSDDDRGYNVQQTTDGGYIISGWTYSSGAGGSDVYLVKTDSSGKKLWEKTFGGSGTEYGTGVQQTADGGYIITAQTSSFGAGSYDVYLIKTDSAGNSQLERTFGGSSFDAGQNVKQTTDGGYIVVGKTLSYGAGMDDVYLIKTDSGGDLVWQKTFGGNGYDYGHSVQQTADGGYIITGLTYPSADSNGDMYLIKTDSGGNLVWQKTFGGGDGDFGWSLDLTTDAGYIIAGGTFSFGAAGDVYLVKTDSDGNSQWEKTFGGVNEDAACCVRQTADGGYIITGWTDWAAPANVYIIKTDSDGNWEWEKTFGGSNFDSGYSVQQTTDGGYIIVGITNSYGAGSYDVYMIKLGYPVVIKDFYFHGVAPDLTLDNDAPMGTTAKYKDSPSLRRTEFKEIGIWGYVVPSGMSLPVDSAGDLHVWVGLKNSDDQGTYFDIHAELLKNGATIASGEITNIQGVTRNPDKAKEVALDFGDISDGEFNPGDVLSLRILAKVTAVGGHSNAVGLRLYYDSVSRPSSLTVSSSP